MELDQDLREELLTLLRPQAVCVAVPVVLARPGPSCDRLVVLSPWRGYLVTTKQPMAVEDTFSYLEICSISVHDHTRVVLETDRLTLSFSVLCVRDLEAVVGHMTASLKRIFPDSSPGKLLIEAPSHLQHTVQTATALSPRPGRCGGFCESYAAVCDLNEAPMREEIQRIVDNIYCKHSWREFNLQHFSHLDSRDVALALSALSFNQWFTKISSKDHRLSAEIQQQLMVVLSRCPGLQQLSLEASGLRLDFAINMAAALKESASSALQSINLSGNAIEDKGVAALSQELKNLRQGLKHLSLSRVKMAARGVGSLGQAFSSSPQLSASLTHLDLSSNPGSLGTEDATFLFKFLSKANCLSHLDLSDTSCPLDTLFVSLSAGCHQLVHLNLARNPFSHRKVRKVTRSIEEFFSRSCQLKYACLSATKLPPQALRLLLQGLAINPGLTGLELDVSSCELRSAGAMVIQEHISEAAAIASLNISDNRLENDMVTLVLSLARCKTLRHLELGRNFTMKSRPLRDVLHRIAQLIQDDECPLQSLSLSDSKLRSGTHILLSALGGHAALEELDISGNHIGDVGAQMLAEALMTNGALKTLHWDRNNVTARGFQDVADALERNTALQQVPLPLDDVTQSYRGNPKGTRDALHKIQKLLDRNKQREGGRVEQQPLEPLQVAPGPCQHLQDSLPHLGQRNLQEEQDHVLLGVQEVQEVQDDMVQEVQGKASKALKLLPALREEDSSCDEDLADSAPIIPEEWTRSLQELAAGLLQGVEWACLRPVRRWGGSCDGVPEGVASRGRGLQLVLRSAVDSAARVVRCRLHELGRDPAEPLDDPMEQILQRLRLARHKLDVLLKEHHSETRRGIVPDLLLDFPPDECGAPVWREGGQAGGVTPASSINSLLHAGWEKQAGDRARGEAGATEEAAEGRRGLPLLLTATPLSLKTPSHSPSWSPSPPGQRGSRRKEGEAVDAAEEISVGRGASFSPPPSPPLLRSTDAPKEEAAGRRRSPRPEAASAGRGSGTGAPASPMEPLPTQGQTLRHYTASRPRPRRKHSQPPSSRPQESESKVENEASEAMGRVDEGVEEFFTKRIIPGYTLKGRWEESNPAQATPSESSSTPSVSTPFSSPSDIITPSITASVDSPTPPSTDTPPPSTDAPPICTPPTPPSVAPTSANPSKNIKKKFGDFFVFKRARAGRAAKAGGGEGGGGGEGVKVKRTSIADLIRPLREAKERERERERGKEREKERGAGSVEDANVSHDAAITEGTTATALHLVGDVREKMAATTTPLSDTTPSRPAAAAATTSPECPAAPPSNLLEDVGPGLGLGVATPPPGPETQSVKSPYGERKLKVSRTLREGKSQSLILLTGLEPEDKDGTPSKKHASESGSTFEQRLQVMLHRMGVAKTPPADTKMSQKNDEELRKANSEGAILDKPAAPPTYMKPRTMSTSSADPRHPLRALDPVRPDPILQPKPILPERPAGPLPPKPAFASRPPVPIVAPPTGGAAPPPSAHPTSASAERVQLGPHDGRSGEAAVQNCNHESPQGAPSTLPPHREGFPSASSPWRSPNAQDRTGKAQSVTDESLPRTRLHVKPPQQRRAVSVHEDALAMTQELKAVLQKSPIRFRGSRGETPSSLGGRSICEEAQRAQARDAGRPTDGEQDGVLVDSGGPGAPAGQEPSQPVPRPAAPAAPDSPPAQSHDLEKSPASHKQSPRTTAASPCPPASPPSPTKTPGSSPAATESSQVPQVKPPSHKKSSPVKADPRTSTQQNPGPAEPAPQRTEPLLSD